ncbi:hypothetical protein ACFQ9H_19645 [Streptomyces sp. NPDC056517]|uniref:hypothetical protein n=1 Tax=Streptomyces sp. NPDC056517 TaxID=3345848 RepID=UPI0036B440A9
MRKICGYCEKPITGPAEDIGDHADYARPPAYWHQLGDPDCYRTPAPPDAVPHIGGVRVDRATYRRHTGNSI